MPADIVAAEDVAAGEEGNENEPAGEPSDYPRQSPSSRSRVTG